MRNTLTLVWKLLVIALAAGLVLGLVNEITRGPIEAQEAVISNETRFKAFMAVDNAEGQKVIKDEEGNEIPVAVCETKKNSGVYYLYAVDDAEKKPIAYAASAKAKGYKDLIEVVVAVAVVTDTECETKCKIINVVIGENSEFSETAGLGSKVKEACFVNQFKGLQYEGNEIEYTKGAGGFRIAAGSLKVEDLSKCNVDGQTFDAVSGATYSSEGALNALNQALAKLYEVIRGVQN